VASLCVVTCLVRFLDQSTGSVVRFGCFMTIYQALRFCNSLLSNSVTERVYQILEKFVKWHFPAHFSQQRTVRLNVCVIELYNK